MEALTNRWCLKVATATLGGFLTFLFGPWAVAFVAAGIMWAPAYANLALGLCALSGLVAFWVWVFIRAPIIALRRRLLSMGIISGIGAALTVLIGLLIRAGWELNIITFSLILGVFIGLGVIVSMWLPSKSIANCANHQ